MSYTIKDKTAIVDQFKTELKASIDSAREQENNLVESSQSEEEFGRDSLVSKKEEMMEDVNTFNIIENTSEDHLMALTALEIKECDSVGFGALVNTDIGCFLILNAMKGIQYKGDNIIGISMQAPVYKELEGKKKGDSFQIQGKSHTINSVI